MMHGMHTQHRLDNLRHSQDFFLYHFQALASTDVAIITVYALCCIVDTAELASGTRCEHPTVGDEHVSMRLLDINAARYPMQWRGCGLVNALWVLASCNVYR